MSSDPTSLDRLHEIVAPGPAPLWPPAPGWSWVMSFLALALVVAASQGLILWRRNQYRREALAEWKKQRALLADAGQRVTALANFAVLLKRTALSIFPRGRVASLTGAEWFVFLDRSASMEGFASGSGAILERAAYEPDSGRAVSADEAQKIAELVRHWLRQHRLSAVEGGADLC